jgi:peptidyl-prolyl cis-trans isomerase C
MYAKRIRWFWAMAITIGLECIALPSLAAEGQTSVSKVAVVNGSVITQEDFDKEMGQVQQRLASMGKLPGDPQLTEFRKEVLESLINRELLYQESKTKGIKVEEEAVNERLKRLEQRFSNEEEFKNALMKMKLSMADIKSQIERGLAVQELIGKQFADSVSVSSKETKAYYDSNPDSFKQAEQVRASHILIKVDPEADKSQKTAARKKTENIQKKLRKGENFGDLAKVFSDDHGSAVKDGDLGYFTRGQMVKPFEEAAFALMPGDVSDVVETRFGYHLIKVTEKRPESTIPYEDVKEKLQQYLKKKEVEKQVSSYVEELKGKAKVERFLAENP